MTRGATDVQEFCRRMFAAMSAVDEADLRVLIHPDATNREAVDEPPGCRGQGPDAFAATARWLTSAYSDLQWEVHDVVQEGDLAVAHATMSGRQTGPFVAYTPQGRVEAVFPPTGRHFAALQTHWLRFTDGQVIEHWANRDDLGMGKQLGWTPPRPAYLIRMLLATRRAKASG